MRHRHFYLALFARKACYQYSCFFAITFGCLFFSGCKKDGVGKGSGEDPGIISLVFNHGAFSTRNAALKQINVTTPDYLDRTTLKAIFQLTAGATAKVSGVVQKSSDSPNDFTGPVLYEVTDGKRTSTWTVKVESSCYEFGLGRNVEKQARLISDYDWYQAQDTSGTLSLINGGPACLSMALKWADPLRFITSTPKMIRESYVPVVSKTTDMFNSVDMANYLTKSNIQWRLVRLSNEPAYTEITSCVDKGYLVILTVDMSKIPYNNIISQHVQRFVEPLPSYAGHYLIVKGYEVVDGELWYETYDPYSTSIRATNGEARGRNRYYKAEAVRNGAYTTKGWPYALVVHTARYYPTIFPAGDLVNQVSETEKAEILNPYKVVRYAYGY